jgi:GNAT superfamily N-acetyltransferase
VGEYDQRIDIFHPRRFVVAINVTPERHGEGIGKELLGTVLTALLPFKPLSVRAFTREDRPRAVRFWKDRGFTEVMRDGGAVLDLDCIKNVMNSGLREREIRLAERGILLKTLAELAADPDRDQKLCDLYNGLLADVPPLGERTRIDLPTFRRLRLTRPDVLPDAFFVAVHEVTHTYVGGSSLYLSPDHDPHRLSTGVTGVRREYRRQGIALALKVRGLEYAARREGVRYISTWNASDNAPILALNEQLGFVREPWRLHLLRVFDDVQNI